MEADRSPRYWRVPDEHPGRGGDTLWQRGCRWLDARFEVSARGSTVATEVWAGCVAFVTMSYIMLVNPVLLSKADPNKTLHFEDLLTATAVSAAIGSSLVGILGNAPVGVVPGLRLNAYFTFGFCHTLEVPWGQALSCCFVAGVLLFLLAILGGTNWIVRTVLSDHLKKALAVAMGIFQAMIGFQMMGLEVTQQHALANLQCQEDRIVTLTNVQCSTTGLCLALGAFCLISGLLVTSRANGALLTGILVIAIGSWMLGLATLPDKVFAAPCFGAAFSLDFSGWLEGGRTLGRMVTGSLVMLCIALFDIAGVLYGLYSIAGLLKHDGVPRSTGVISGIAIGTMAGSLLGTSPLVIANESSAGIMEGARTGLSAVVVAGIFALSAFIAPLISSIPDLAAAAPLVLTGAFMMQPIQRIAWDNLRVAIPAFVTILLVPYCVHNGIIAGIFVDILLGLICNISRFACRAEAVSPEIDRPLQTPHSFVSVSVGLHDAEKVERAKQLLHDLGPPCTNRQRSETWEIALRQALELYLTGMQPALAENPRAA